MKKDKLIIQITTSQFTQVEHTSQVNMRQSVHMQKTTADASKTVLCGGVKQYNVKNKIHGLGGKLHSLSSALIVQRINQWTVNHMPLFRAQSG